MKEIFLTFFLLESDLNTRSLAVLLVGQAKLKRPRT